MDWLSANRFMLNCSDRAIVFPLVSSPESVTPVNIYLSSLAVHDCRDRSQGYILLSTNITELDQKIDGIPVVREYLDVFPEYIPKFPPEREIEFAIELVPGTGPISIALFQMSPLELTELKKQIEELQGKRFIRPSASPWGSPNFVS